MNNSNTMHGVNNLKKKLSGSLSFVLWHQSSATSWCHGDTGTPDLSCFVMPQGYQSWASTIPLNWTKVSLTSINPDGRTPCTVWGYLQHLQCTSLHWSANSLKTHILRVSLGKVVQVAINVCQRVVRLPRHAVTWTQTRTEHEYKYNFPFCNNGFYLY